MAVQRQDGWANDSAPGSVDLTGKERRFVTVVSGAAYPGRAVRLAAAGERIHGVLQEGKAAGLWSSWAISGHPLKVIAGASIAIGDAIQSGADGVAVPGTTNQIGVARNACFSGEMCEVMTDRVT